MHVDRSNIRIVNIEIDGPSHEYPAKRKFCALRDEVLSKMNVEVIRWDIMTLEGMDFLRKTGLRWTQAMKQEELFISEFRKIAEDIARNR